MRLAIFTHVIHKKFKGDYYAYSPYVREMNLWFKHVKEVEIVAPLDERRRRGEKVMRGQGEPYKHSCIVFTKIPSFHLLNFPAVLDSLIKVPFIFFRILGAMRRADHLHLRCPGNIGLLAAIAQIFFPKKPKTAKYAGNWDPESVQPWSYRLQKWILGNSFLSRNIKVLVYGEWENQGKNVIPFFTASYSETEKEEINKAFSSPYRFVFAGTLSEGKRPLLAVQILHELLKNGWKVRLDIYGEGKERESIENYIAENGLRGAVILHGNQNKEILKEAYIKSHFSILPSRSEGWPKAVAEGMFFGCIPVATSISCVPWMLADGKRGILLPPQPSLHSTKRGKYEGRVQESVEKIGGLLKNEEEMKRISIEAQEWSRQYTLEKFREEIYKLL